MTARECWNERVLRPLVCQAFELRESPYLLDAIAAIVDAHARMPLTLLESRQERNARVISLLRETDPVRIGASRRAA